MKQKSIMLDILEMSSTDNLIRNQLNTQYEKCSKEYQKLENKFLAGLTEEQRQEYEEVFDAYSDVRIAYSDELFRQGMSLGIRLTAEAYMIGGMSEIKLKE